ncbi:hypothetical protein CYK37_30165 [Mesorhizobium loti]|nr:hypothetical protein CYK37_30165 [Mesorhizobium loti]
MTNDPSLPTLIIATVACLGLAIWMHRRGDKTGRGVALAFAALGVVSAIGRTLADNGHYLLAMF